jgi:hypothetical protein
MSTTTALEIARNQWVPYFNDFSKQYQGWAVTIEVLDRELGDQHRVDNLPFQGISYDPAGSQAGDILVETGDAGTPYETHLIHRPRIVRAAITQPGAEADVEIESEEGYITLVRLRRRPELPPA